MTDPHRDRLARPKASNPQPLDPDPCQHFRHRLFLKPPFVDGRLILLHPLGLIGQQRVGSQHALGLLDDMGATIRDVLDLAFAGERQPDSANVILDAAVRFVREAVRARGPVLEVRVNGVLTARLEDADTTAGFIALQHWGEGTVRFRRIEVQLL